MPRDSNGTMTLAKPPFVAGTASVASDVNAVLEDLRSEVQDSLSRSGKGGMSVPIEHFDGTEALPGISFGSEASSGLYRSAANVWRAVVGGSWVAKFTATALELRSLAADGASAVAHVLDTSTAWVNATAKLLSVRNNGVEKAYIAKDGQGVFPALTINSPSGSGVTVNATTGFAIDIDSDGVGTSAIRINSQGTAIDTTANTSDDAILAYNSGSGVGLRARHGTSRGAINITPDATTPAAPQDGDIWYDSSGGHALKVRINGVTKTFTVA